MKTLCFPACIFVRTEIPSAAHPTAAGHGPPEEEGDGEGSGEGRKGQGVPGIST